MRPTLRVLDVAEGDIPHNLDEQRRVAARMLISKKPTPMKRIAEDVAEAMTEGSAQSRDDLRGKVLGTLRQLKEEGLENLRSE